jgi:hypothetical protein
VSTVFNQVGRGILSPPIKPRLGTSLSAATCSASTGVVFGGLFEVQVGVWLCEAGDIDGGLFSLGLEGWLFSLTPTVVPHQSMLQPAKTDWACLGETVGTSSTGRPVSHSSPHTSLRRSFLLVCMDEYPGDYFHQ